MKETGMSAHLYVGAFIRGTIVPYSGREWHIADSSCLILEITNINIIVLGLYLFCQYNIAGVHCKVTKSEMLSIHVHDVKR